MPLSGSRTPSSSAASGASPSPTSSAGREFYGLDILATPAVLIPRQETELLVEGILEIGAGRADLTVADVGTGSGAIAVAAAVNLPFCRVYATDTSESALRVAEANCRMHGVEDRVEPVHGDLLCPLDGPVDVIASNPPYVRTDEIAALGREIGHEPIEALDGGRDGLDVVRRLFQQAPAALKPGGAMLLEIDPRQLQDVMSLATPAFPGGQVSYRRRSGWPPPHRDGHCLNSKNRDVDYRCAAVHSGLGWNWMEFPGRRW